MPINASEQILKSVFYKNLTVWFFVLLIFVLFKNFQPAHFILGRGRKYFEYEKEMEEIFCNKKNVHPVLLLSSNTKDDLPQNETNSNEKTPELRDLSQDEVVDGNFAEDKKQGEETPRVKHSKAKIYRKKTSTIEKTRLDRKEYYNERLEIERRKLEQMEQRNNLIAQRNTILKEHNCGHCTNLSSL